MRIVLDIEVPDTVSGLGQFLAHIDDVLRPDASVNVQTYVTSTGDVPVTIAVNVGDLLIQGEVSEWL